jgi:Zinc-binding dehydrogenase
VALITDPLGGNHWKKSYKALRSTGRLGMFGFSVATTSKLFGPLRLLPVALGMPLFHPLALMNTNKSAFGVNVGHMWHETDMIAGWMEILLKGVADGWVRPHVDKSFPLAQVGEAQTYIKQAPNYDLLLSQAGRRWLLPETRTQLVIARTERLERTPTYCGFSPNLEGDARRPILPVARLIGTL